MPPISVTIFASDPGTYFLEDDGIAGNNFSRIRFPDGTTVAFEHPTDDLFFDPSVAGVTLVINLVDSLGTSRFSTGDFADPLSTRFHPAEQHRHGSRRNLDRQQCHHRVW